MKIKNLLLDMGGVILDVDYTKIIAAFEKFGVDARTLYTQSEQLPFIDDFEEGKITPAQFRDEVRKTVQKNLSDNDIDSVWNSMVESPRVKDIKLLSELRNKYEKIFLFSNTNDIHIDLVKKLFAKEMGFDVFSTLFDKAYLSNEIHVRKPHKESFLWVLNDAKIKAEETLFIDDTIKNIQGAEQAGLNTYLLEKPQTLTDLHNKNII